MKLTTEPRIPLPDALWLAEPIVRCIDEWEPDWDETTGLYKETDPNLVAPINYNVAMAETLLEAGYTLQIPKWTDRALRITSEIGKTFRDAPDGGYIWPYSSLPGRDIDTIAYAAMMFRLAAHLLDYELPLFGDKNADAFGVTFRRCQTPDGYSYGIDGNDTPKSGYETCLAYAAPLSRHVPWLAHAIRADFLNPDIPAGPRSMTAVGLAELLGATTRPISVPW